MNVFSGTIIKQGEVLAEVTSTGANTRFGQMTGLVDQAKTLSHFQKAVLTIGNYLIYVSLTLVVILVLVQLHRREPWLDLAQFALILTVASIPVAMPAVLSMTMAVGAMLLSKKKAIVTRLESIEEMASMDILCSDKTGTLTHNKLILGDVVPFTAGDAQEILLLASLASKEENHDAILMKPWKKVLKNKELLAAYKLIQFTPFDPVHKRTEATVQDAEGEKFQVSKGAPQVIMNLAALTRQERERADKVVDDFARQGFRALGVGMKREADKNWSFLGILSLFDPPREDSAQTVARAEKYGVTVKMVTSDNLATAGQISDQLGMGTNILKSEILPKSCAEGALGEVGEQVEQADGFAEVFPEQKILLTHTSHQGHLNRRI